MHLTEISHGTPVQSGWADDRLGQAYELIAEAIKAHGSQVYRHPLLAAVEQADIDIKEGLEP